MAKLLPIRDTRTTPESLTQYELKLRGWIREWYCHAVAEALVHSCFFIDDADVERLEGYFISGLTPAEATLAFFGRAH
ncbi:hypothetical protein PTKU46_82430 [Paraburkholderia terrae]